MPKRANKAPCPACKHPVSAVVDSRGLTRIRQCVQCKERWLTEEVYKRRIRPYTPKRAA